MNELCLMSSIMIIAADTESHPWKLLMFSSQTRSSHYVTEWRYLLMPWWWLFFNGIYIWPLAFFFQLTSPPVNIYIASFLWDCWEVPEFISPFLPWYSEWIWVFLITTLTAVGLDVFPEGSPAFSLSRPLLQGQLYLSLVSEETEVSQLWYAEWKPIFKLLSCWLLRNLCAW